MKEEGLGLNSFIRNGKEVIILVSVPPRQQLGFGWDFHLPLILIKTYDPYVFAKEKSEACCLRSMVGLPTIMGHH